MFGIVRSDVAGTLIWPVDAQETLEGGRFSVSHCGVRLHGSRGTCGPKIAAALMGAESPLF